MDPFPAAYRVVTPRLVVRCYEPADAEALQRAGSESRSHLIAWLPWAVHEPQTLDEKLELARRFRGQFDLGLDYVYGLFARADDAFVGGSGLHLREGPDPAARPEVREIGYWLHPDHTGRGLMTEAVGALTRVALEVLGVVRIEIRCDPSNERSRRVPERLGYRLEGRLRGHLAPDATAAHPRDTEVWGLVRDDLAGSPCAAVPCAAYDALGRELLGPPPDGA